MNLTVSETAGKRSKGHRGLLALVAQRAGEARQALTVARDMMARPGAVHTLRTRLAAAMPVEPRRADCSRQSVAGEGEGISRQHWTEQEAYYNETGHDKSDQGSTEKSRPEELKQKRRAETAKEGRRRKSQSLL